MATNGSGATLVRRQLGSKLRDLRKGARKSRADVELAGVVSDTTLWRIEAGRRPTRYPIVQALCELYGADEEQTAALVDLAKASNGTGWFEHYGDAIPRRLGLFFSAELAASKISAYDPEWVPGSLQTPDYARAIFEGESPTSSPEEIDQLMEVRLERQARFWADRSRDAQQCVVLNQGALVREVGGRGTMRAQVDHLREVGGQSGLDVRILRWEVGGHPASYGGYTIFEFPSPEDAAVVFLESYTGIQHTEAEPDVARMLNVHEQVYRLSTPIQDYVHP